MTTFHPDPKPDARHVATREEWADIARQKAGPCRVCGSLYGIELHHLVNRSQRGDDTANNVIPLCQGCHRQVTNRDHAVVHLVRASLTVEEEMYCVHKKSQWWLDDTYPTGGDVLCSRCKRPVRAQEPRSAPRKRKRYQCSCPDDAEDGVEILIALVQANRERLKDVMGWSDDVPDYYVHIAVHTEGLQRG